MTAKDVYGGNKVSSDMKRVRKLYRGRRRRRREEKRARRSKIRIGGRDMLLPPWPEHYTRVTAGKAKPRQPQSENESRRIHGDSPESNGVKVQRHCGRWRATDEGKGTAPQVWVPDEALARSASSVRPSSTVSVSKAIGAAFIQSSN